MANRRHALINRSSVIGDVDLTAYAALADDETITGNWLISGTGPRLDWYETDAGSDEKRWRIDADVDVFRFVATTDAGTASTFPMAFRRTGTTIDEVEINATALDVNATVDVSGEATFNDHTTFTGAGGALDRSIHIESADALILFDETDAPTDEGVWLVGANGAGLFRILARTDADDGGTTPLSIQRTGTVIDEVEFNGTLIDANAALDVSGQITVAAGTQSAPGYSFNGDADSGLWRAAANTLGLVAGTVSIARLNSNGILIDVGSVRVTEAAAAVTDVAGVGQFWVKDDAPNVPMFTDDAGTDFNLITGSSPTLNGSLVYSKGWVTALDISEVTDVLALTTDLTGVAAGDIYDVEITGILLNNSGGNRVTTWTLDFDGLFDVEFNQTLGFSATQWLPLTIKARFVVVSSSLSYCTWNCYTAAGIQTAGTDVAMGTSSQAHSWNTSTTDATGTVTVTLHFRSANAAATQNWTQLSATIRKSQVV